MDVYTGIGVVHNFNIITTYTSTTTTTYLLTYWSKSVQGSFHTHYLIYLTCVVMPWRNCKHTCIKLEFSKSEEF